jgi:hypothetical protein
MNAADQRDFAAFQIRFDHDGSANSATTRRRAGIASKSGRRYATPG